MIVDESTASDLDKWFKDFIERQEKPTIVTDDIILDLARSLCDDIPLGYEASHRLANLLFCYINRPRLSSDEINRSKELLEKYNSKNVHPAIKIAVLLVANRLTVNTINAITKQIENIRDDAVTFLY